MQRILISACVAALLGAAPAMAADNARTCTLTKVFECTSEGGCQELSLREMALPRFFRVDLQARTISSLDRDVQRAPTKVTAIESIEGMLVLHGAEKRGWSMTLGERSGNLTLSATDEDGGFIVFGSCMSP